MSSNAMEEHHKQAEPWEVTLVDTGSTTLTSGRLKRVRLFMASYRWMLTRCSSWAQEQGLPSRLC